MNETRTLSYDEVMRMYWAINYLNRAGVRWLGVVKRMTNKNPWPRPIWVIVPF